MHLRDGCAFKIDRSCLTLMTFSKTLIEDHKMANYVTAIALLKPQVEQVDTKPAPVQAKTTPQRDWPADFKTNAAGGSAGAESSAPTASLLVETLSVQSSGEASLNAKYAPAVVRCSLMRAVCCCVSSAAARRKLGEVFIVDQWSLAIG